MSGINRGLKALRRTLDADKRKRAWHYIDAKDMVVGRLATNIVPLLTGKYRPDYSPHVDSGDYVVVRFFVAVVKQTSLRGFPSILSTFCVVLSGCQHFEA